MDRKTLEYMEERAKKARDIVNRIDGLTKRAGMVGEIVDINFSNKRNDSMFAISLRYPRFGESENRFLNLLKSSLQQMIVDEIALLEKELAEL